AGIGGRGAQILRGRVTMPVAAKPVKIDVEPRWWDNVFAPSSCLVLITTVDRQGTVNAAAFGTCTRVCHEPMYIAFTCSADRDTTNNALATGEFVVNVVPFEQAVLDKVPVCGPPSRRGVNERGKAGLTAMAARMLRPPRIAECRAHFECRVEWTRPWLYRVMICGKVEAVSIDDGCLDADGFIVWDKVKPAHYCGMRYRDRFVPAYDKPTPGVWRYDGRDEEFRAGENWGAGYRSEDWAEGGDSSPRRHQPVSARHARPDTRQAEGDCVLRPPRRRGRLRRVHAAVERAPHRRVREADRASSRRAGDRSRLRLRHVHRAARARRLRLRRARHFRQARHGRAPQASADRIRRLRHRAPAGSRRELRRRAVERRAAPIPRSLAVRGRALPPAAPARAFPRLRPQPDESVHVALPRPRVAVLQLRGGDRKRAPRARARGRRRVRARGLCGV